MRNERAAAHSASVHANPNPLYSQSIINCTRIELRHTLDNPSNAIALLPHSAHVSRDQHLPLRLTRQQHFTEVILNSITRYSAFAILAIISILAFSGCSQKPTSEEIAAQVKAALAEEKAKEQAAAPAPAPVAEAPSPNPVVQAKPVTKEKRAHAKPAAPAKKIVCDNCGVVVSVQEVEVAGKGSGLGVIAGGVAGGLAGNQVGQGTGRDLATIAGIVGGAIAGNKVEEKIKKTRVFDVTVKLDNGEERVLRSEAAPGVIAGDKIKLEGEKIVRQ
jgi:outer membrane lipoprotein SlyB